MLLVVVVGRRGSHVLLLGRGQPRLRLLLIENRLATLLGPGVLTVSLERVASQENRTGNFRLRNSASASIDPIFHICFLRHFGFVLS